MRRLFVSLTAAAIRPMSMSMSVAASRTAPPVARRVPYTVRFGKVAGENRGPNPMDPPLEVVDDLFWMRDDTRKDEEILQHLRDENDYTQARTAHLDDFRTSLYDEMLSHIQEDDDTFPSPAPDGFEYWSRTVKGAAFRQYLRRPVGASKDVEQCYLDVNAVPSLPYFAQVDGWDAAQCDVTAITPSPSGGTLAYCVDGSGYETYNIRLKDLSSGAELTETIVDTAGSVAWAGEEMLFYVRFDAAHRPHQVCVSSVGLWRAHPRLRLRLVCVRACVRACVLACACAQVWRHVLGTDQADDVMVYEDADELFNVGVWSTRDGSLVIVESESKETTGECRPLDLLAAHVVGLAAPPPTVGCVRLCALACAACIQSSRSSVRWLQRTRRRSYVRASSPSVMTSTRTPRPSHSSSPQTLAAKSTASYSLRRSTPPTAGRQSRPRAHRCSRTRTRARSMV